MKTVNRGLTLALVLALLVSTMALPAFAAEVDTIDVAHETVQITDIENVEITGPTDVLNGMQRELSLPKEYWDLESSDYDATLKQVGRDHLYTNYYFYPDSNGKLRVDVNAKAEGGGKLIVGIYNITDKYNATSTSFDIDAVGISKSVTFSNMDTNDYYAVYFCSDYNGFNVVYITGTAVVYH